MGALEKALEQVPVVRAVAVSQSWPWPRTLTKASNRPSGENAAPTYLLQQGRKSRLLARGPMAQLARAFAIQYE
jgi:hypothetical protein